MKATVYTGITLSGVIWIFTFLAIAFTDSPLLSMQQAEEKEAAVKWTKSAVDRIQNPPLGLPPVPYPDENTPVEEKIWLGKKVFFDARLSKDGKISCASCHFPRQGFAENNSATSMGFANRPSRRNTPTLLNVAYFDRLFHDKYYRRCKPCPY